MRIAFAGTPEFSVPALEALVQAGHTVAAVFTQPDRPAGRGRRLQASPVGRRAQDIGLPVHKPQRFDAEAQARLAEADVALMVVVAYGLILPQAALDIPRYGCLNIHASLLPRWRGAAPIQRAIEAGDAETGVCIMQMEAGLDTGPIWRRAATPISESDTAATVHDRLAELGAREVVAALPQVAEGRYQPEAQPEAGVTYARKLDKAEARIDWRDDAATIARRIRAFNPVPGAWSCCGDARVRMLDARALATLSGEAPGTVLEHDAEGVVIATGDAALRLLCVQWPGGRPQEARVVAAERFPIGQVLT
ncbi:methionyl-tRNA formyltransferase [Algiphilus sp. NNCM1]|uniref:methionyl-tRNA formyltransferase n=1 Tax=Algiphilus sp. TaxID=1872431 RepID=UPI001CA6830A|nr:methionyl-tRNA formyltransferase [Algiphilus sp.]MBY8964526.1 methionyl-tRNA formyltransferase [Algiphilus acroporae]MCI5063258.1 methionyl-tRNA formyltransferase [Algiphilus sp.]MCI5103514.1 methionyl-tRNA formyltransferase [Algiphilus sp.]